MIQNCLYKTTAQCTEKLFHIVQSIPVDKYRNIGTVPVLPGILKVHLVIDGNSIFYCDAFSVAKTILNTYTIFKL